MQTKIRGDVMRSKGKKLADMSNKSWKPSLPFYHIQLSLLKVCCLPYLDYFKNLLRSLNVESWNGKVVLHRFSGGISIFTFTNPQWGQRSGSPRESNLWLGFRVKDESAGWTAPNHPAEGGSSLHHPAAMSSQHNKLCLRFVTATTETTQTSTKPSD